VDNVVNFLWTRNSAQEKSDENHKEANNVIYIYNTVKDGRGIFNVHFRY